MELKTRAKGSHESKKMINDEWLTPRSLIENIGVFDLDPCSPISRPWNTAKKHYSLLDNGLMMNWKGRVWMNPPYGLEMKHWLNKMCLHGNGVVLVFARTETANFFNYVWDQAHAILFIKGRIHFHYVDGTRCETSAGAPSCLIAYGKENAIALKNSAIAGKFILLK